MVTHTNLKTMKTRYYEKTMKTALATTLDFLEVQQQEDNHTTNQLHLIIQTLATFLDDEQMQEVENLFNQFKN